MSTQSGENNEARPMGEDTLAQIETAYNAHVGGYEYKEGDWEVRPSEEMEEIWLDTDHIGGVWEEVNARIIVLARNNFPQLAQEIRRLWAENAVLEEERDRYESELSEWQSYGRALT